MSIAYQGMHLILRGHDRGRECEIHESLRGLETSHLTVLS